MADIGELVIRIRATAEDLESALQSANQKLQGFARKVEQAAGAPIKVNVQTDGVQQAEAKIASLSTLVSTASAQTIAPKVDTSGIQAAAQGAQEVQVSSGTAADAAIGAFEGVIVAIAGVGVACVAMGAVIAQGINTAVQSIQQLPASVAKAGQALSIAGAQGQAAGIQAATGATTATVATKGWTAATEILKGALGGIGSTLVALAITAVIDWIKDLIANAEEAQKRQEELKKRQNEINVAMHDATQDEITERKKLSTEYRDNTSKIREYADEYATLRTKSRSASEENRFLKLQDELAELLGVTSEAIYVQSASLDAWKRSSDAAANTNVGNALKEGKELIELYKQAAELKAGEFIYLAHKDISDEGFEDFKNVQSVAELNYLRQFYFAPQRQAMEDTQSNYRNQLAEMFDVMLGELTDQGIKYSETAAEVLKDSLVNSLVLGIDFFVNDPEKGLDPSKSMTWLQAWMEQNVESAKVALSDMDLASGIAGFGGIVDQILFGSMTPEDAADDLTAQMEIIIETAKSMYMAMGEDADTATLSAWALFDTFTKGERDMRVYAASALATSQANIMAATGAKEMETQMERLNTSVTKLGQMKTLVTGTKDLVQSFKQAEKGGKDTSGILADINKNGKALGIGMEMTAGNVGEFEEALNQTETSVDSALGQVRSQLQSVVANAQAAENALWIDGLITANEAPAHAALMSILQDAAKVQEAMDVLGALGESEGRRSGGGSRRKSKAELAEEARRAAEEARQEAIRQDYALLDHQKHMNQLTLEDELSTLHQIRQAHELNAEEIMEWERKVYDLKKEIRQRDVSSIDKAGDAVIQALGARHQAMQDAEIQRLDASRKAWEDWRDDSVQAIRDQIAALDELSKTQDREKLDQEELRKIAKLRQDIEFEQDSYNRMKLQQQLDQAISAREDRLRRLAVQDQKDALQKQIEAIQDQAEAQFAVLDSEQEEIEKAYAERMKTAALRAEAEKLLMTGNQQEIINLLGEFAPEYDALGKTLGEKLLEGFQSKVGSVVSWFQSLNDSLYQTQERAASQAIAAANQFQSGYQERQQGSAAAVDHLPGTGIMAKLWKGVRSKARGVAGEAFPLALAA